MYRERTSRSTMRVRSAAKSIAWPTNPSPRTQPINYRSRGDQEGDEDRREDQRGRGDGESCLHEVFHGYGNTLPGRDLHDDDVARGPEDRRVAGERRARGEPEPELRRASRNDRREQENRRHVADQVRQQRGKADQPDEAAGLAAHRGREAALDRGGESGDADPLEDDEEADEEEDDAPVYLRDQGPGSRLREEGQEKQDERAAGKGHQRQPDRGRGREERGRHADRHPERHDETSPLKVHGLHGSCTGQREREVFPKRQPDEADRDPEAGDRHREKIRREGEERYA